MVDKVHDITAKKKKTRTQLREPEKRKTKRTHGMVLKGSTATVIASRAPTQRGGRVRERETERDRKTRFDLTNTNPSNNKHNTGHENLNTHTSIES